MKICKSVLRKEIDSFQNGKYKGKTLKDLCSIYMIDRTTLSRKLTNGNSLSDSLLIRGGKSQYKYTSKELNYLKGLGIVFRNKDYYVNNKDTLLNNFQNGKYKNYKMSELCRLFGYNYGDAMTRLNKGESLDDILLNRTSKSIRYMSDTRKKELEELGVKFNNESSNVKYQYQQDKNYNKVVKCLETFKDGKYKDYNLFKFCKLYHTSLKSIYSELDTGKSFEDIILNRPKIHKITKESVLTMENNLGVKFGLNDKDNVKWQSKIDSFQKGKYKGKNLRVLSKIFYKDYNEVLRRLNNKESLKQILLVRGFKDYKKLSKDQIYDLIHNLGVQFKSSQTYCKVKSNKKVIKSPMISKSSVDYSKENVFKRTLRAVFKVF